MPNTSLLDSALVATALGAGFSLGVMWTGGNHYERYRNSILELHGLVQPGKEAGDPAIHDGLRAAVLRRTEGDMEADGERRLFRAICQVESGNNPRPKPGDDGQSIGICQIRPIFVRDVNLILGHNKYTLDDRWDAQKSHEMFDIYHNHYAKAYERQTGRKATLEVMARQHCGGPDGWKQASSVDYWHKVRRELEKDNHAH